MTDTGQMGNRDIVGLLRELAGTTCRCGRIKRSGETFCRSCYHQLLPSLRSNLYSRIGAGYVEAYAAAVLNLDKELLI